MSVATTYTPEKVKLKVGDHLVSGYQNDCNFISGDESIFKVFLHWGSESIGPLRGKQQQAQKVTFEAGLSKSAYIDGELMVSPNGVKSLDFAGNYYIGGPYFEYSPDGVFVQFTFVKQN